MKRKSDDIAEYLAKVEGVFVSLFRIAYAIIGNRELAQYVLRSAIVEAYLRRKEWQGRMSFQDGMEHTVRGVAMAELKRIRQVGAFETDWTLPHAPERAPSQFSGQLRERLERESEGTQRIALLYYACQLSHRQIGQVLQMRPGEVAGRLRRLTSRLVRSLRLKGQRGQHALETQLEKLLSQTLTVRGEDVPEMQSVFRSFERDVAGATRPKTSAVRVIGTVLKVVGALLLAALIWLMAVLLEPSNGQPEASSAPTTEMTQNIND